MSVEINRVAPSAPEGAEPAEGGQSPLGRRLQLARLVTEFEASLMMQMIKEMREAARWDDEEESGGVSGAQSLFEMLDAELATQMTRSDRLGLTTQLGPTFGLQTGPEAPRKEALDPRAVTSGFGWRRDPMTGKPTFHKGIDIRAAYGEDVGAAASGRVVAAGTQNGYGTTVVVEHPDGTRTRYGHLSLALVQPGDEVARGQVIGRAGSTGRATGPHVHFELIDRNGVPVDPQKQGK